MGWFVRRGGFRGLCICAALLIVAHAGLAEGPGEFSYAALEGGGVAITGYVGDGARAAVPAELDGAKVTAIGTGAFAGCESVAEIVLPEGVEALGDGAFADCYSLESIRIPATVTQVGANPFAGCENLRKLDLADGQETLLTINGVLFGDGGARLIFCPRALPMERYAVPEGVVTIDARAFCYCNRLLSVTLPDSVAEIGAGAFNARANLTLIVGRGSCGEAYARQNGIKYTYDEAGGWLAE